MIIDHLVQIQMQPIIIIIECVCFCTESHIAITKIICCSVTMSDIIFCLLLKSSASFVLNLRVTVQFYFQLCAT